MATNYHYFSGKVKWAKVRKPDEKYNKFSINLYPNDDTIAAIKKAGVSTRPKVDLDTKEVFYTFRRDVEKKIKDQMVQFGPPKVINADGTDFEGLIGNGSTCTIKVGVYDTAMGKGSRLEAVRIDELVEYNPPNRENETGTDSLVGVPF